MRTVIRAFALLATVCVVLSIVAMVAFGHLHGWRIPDWHLPDPSVQTARVNADAVNLRAAPSTGATILDVLPHGTVLTVTGEIRDGFAPVEYDGTSAWMFADYLSGDTPEPADPGMVVHTARAAEPAADDPAPPPVLAPEPERDPEPESSDNRRTSPGVVEQPDVPTGEHWIDVDRGTATVTLYIGDSPRQSFTARIGRDPSADGFYSTAVGTFHVFSMDSNLNFTPFVDNVYMTDFVGFDPERHNGFHSPIRDAFGAILPSQNATTLGCVRLSEEAAQQVYSFASIGMRVEIHD